MNLGSAAIRLDAFHDAPAPDATDEERLLLAELEGFLTAIAAGPETLKPDEWLEQFLDGEATEPEIVEQAKFMLSLTVGQYDAIRSMLANEPKAYTPFFVGTGNGDNALTEAWVDGFMGAVGQRPEAWQAIFNCEARDLLVPILAFTRDADGSFVLTADNSPEIAKLRAEAGKYLPDVVVGVYRFFTETRQFFEGSKKLGRNDPCFCGSGKKFKKCCGVGRS